MLLTHFKYFYHKTVNRELNTYIAGVKSSMISASFSCSLPSAAVHDMFSLSIIQAIKGYKFFKITNSLCEDDFTYPAK